MKGVFLWTTSRTIRNWTLRLRVMAAMTIARSFSQWLQVIAVAGNRPITQLRCGNLKNQQNGEGIFPSPFCMY